MERQLRLSWQPLPTFGGRRGHAGTLRLVLLTSPVFLKLLATLVVAIAALVVAGTAGAAGGAVKGVGGGWIGFPFTSQKDVHFGFSAHSGPNGDFGQLALSIRDPVFPLDLKLDIDCLSVFAVPMTNGGAWLSGVVTSVRPDPNLDMIFVGQRLYFAALDGGEPSDPPVDSLEAWFDFGVSCKLLPPYAAPPDVTHGNIVISDGS